MQHERCSATRRDGERCQAPAVKGATVCRRHGGAAPRVKRNAEQREALRQLKASLPYQWRWVNELVGEQRRYYAGLASGDRPRRCKAQRRDGQPCRNWSIRGGYVCRMHGGAAPQVKAKARARVEMARIYREAMAAATARNVTPRATSRWGVTRRHE